MKFMNQLSRNYRELTGIGGLATPYVGRQQHGVFDMKKLLAALLAATITFAVAAPSFAYEIPNCTFSDKSLCKTESSSMDSGND
jgi:hypothetical protein